MARSSRFATLAVLFAALAGTPAVVACADTARADTAATTAQSSDGNAAADLDQCRNGPVSAPVACTGGAWVNGNANAIHAHYLEGDSIVYRMRFDDLAVTSHTVTIEWDTTENGKHAIDYLTTYNRTEATAAPCSGVASCGGATTFPIPVDPYVAAEGVSQVPGVFTMYNATITDVSSYARTGSFAGNSQTSITIAFTAANSTPVLTWSGHISTRADWGLDNSAVAISGSPYHMRLLDLDGQGGNQDRSLSTDAVVFPATTTTTTSTTTTTTTSTTTTSTTTTIPVTAVALAISKTDGGARPVAGQGTFTYALEVDNLGPSDATSDATVVDVLPAEVEFVSFGTLADGVTCEPPSGRSFTCAVANDLLAVDDPPVEILVVVRVAAGATVAEIANVAIVTSPDDEAPCDVSATAITCNPADTNNFASVTTPLASVAGAVTEARSPGLAFTGSDGGRLAILGVALVAVGAGCLIGSRRRRARAR
jgi:uncharacterized membrane protein